MEVNQAIEDWLATSLKGTGIPLDQGKVVFCLLLAYPLGFIFSLLPNIPNLKHFIGLVLGVWFAWFTVGEQIIHSFVSSLVTYLILVTFDVKKGLAHKLVFIWIMGYMSVSHIYRMLTDYMGWTMDFTGPQMLLTIKLTTFAFDLYDGLTIPYEKMNGHQKQMHLKRMPNVLEFFGFVYFFGGFLAGPAFNMKEYLSYTDLTLFKDTPNGRMPSAFVPTLKILFQTIFITAGVFANMAYPLSYCLTPEYEQSSFFYRIGYIWFAASLCRFPYYFAWKLSEGSCNLMGVGYTSYDAQTNKAKWDRATNCRVLNLELSQNFKEITDAWNIRTDHWLKHYIYERVTKFGLPLTFITSAVWHGFYPGYYLSFLSASLIVQTARLIRRNLRSRFVEEDGVTPKSGKKLYDLVCLLVTSLTLNYVMVPFKVLAWEYSWKIWMSVYFCIHIAVAATYVFCNVVGAPKKKKTT